MKYVANVWVREKSLLSVQQKFVQNAKELEKNELKKINRSNYYGHSLEGLRMSVLSGNEYGTF